METPINATDILSPRKVLPQRGDVFMPQVYYTLLLLDGSEIRQAPVEVGMSLVDKLPVFTSGFSHIPGDRRISRPSAVS